MPDDNASPAPRRSARARPKSPPPVAVHVVRGDMIESRHRASIAVVDADGTIIESHGDVTVPVYPRSAIKPIQALPVVETGAADRFAMTGPELALACASHGGEPAHVETVAALLKRIGCSVADLACGAHPPYHVPSAHALIRAGAAPSALHNNCSGKHAAMLATARHMGEPIRDYIAPDHPVQRRVVRTFEEMCGVDLSRAPRGIDGCSLPQIGIPLSALARGIARFGAPDALPRERAAACRRLAAAMTANPMMVAGTGRFCTAAMEIAAGKAIVKTGAEGMYMAAIPARGIGIALKIEDGAARAAEVALAALLVRYADLDEAQRARLSSLLEPPVQNVNGWRVGRIAPASGL
ncbi:MAG TPA: asparaginase [Alphaproteobacteria bacterium]